MKMGKNKEDINFGFDLSENVFRLTFQYPYDCVISMERNPSKMVLEVKDYFHEESELKGLKAERKFKEFLDEKKLPYLYVGQKWEGAKAKGLLEIEKSEALFSNYAKRPDFILPHPTRGSIFVDVKSRTGNYFTISIKDVKKFIKLQEEFNIPVWIAFVSAESEHWLEPSETFKFISINAIGNSPAFKVSNFMTQWKYKEWSELKMLGAEVEEYFFWVSSEYVFHRRNYFWADCFKENAYYKYENCVIQHDWLMEQEDFLKSIKWKVDSNK